ncbi:MAG: DEAD/DEAH box helicase [Bacteroidales bacterium]|jgi:SNF2 family DNA or RNA helicase|nr:DEAD/DEAH box helicase [Bacteroidales bacterium]
MLQKIDYLVAEVEAHLSEENLQKGKQLQAEHRCILLSQSAVCVDFMFFMDAKQMIECKFLIDRGDFDLTPYISTGEYGWNAYTYACLLQYRYELSQLIMPQEIMHKQYTRKGMMKRVLDERREKANKANYKIQWADNIFGDHVLYNERGIRYKIFLRDFEQEIGYSDSADAQVNKLGTTKHIMFAFKQLKNDPALYNRLDKKFPFIEIYCDPLNHYRISWYYPYPLQNIENELITKYFHGKKYIEDENLGNFLGFFDQSSQMENIRVRPEVRQKVENYFEELMLKDLQQKQSIDFSVIKSELFPFQQEGVQFAVFRKAAIIADEMGLGKTIQAITTAVIKKKIFGFQKTLVVCPATLKSQWKQEIERFTNEKALIINGLPEERKEQYNDSSAYFYIINYETILRDSQVIARANFDFLILDEAQKIKNYETKTASSINRIHPKHTLVITGTPIENKLLDIFSILSVVSPHFLGPLWEFSYQHCLFDSEKPNKINGYYNLQALNDKLSEILIRREKHAVIQQLPSIQHIDVPIELSPLQQEYHGSYLRGVAQIIRKKYLTNYDIQRLMLLLQSARMVCDSTFLADDKTNESPKLIELQDILFEKLDILHQKRKIIIFSEWIKVHYLIAQMLQKQGVQYVELNGKVPVNERSNLIGRFEQDPDCNVFLSTEAGGAGLNLQVADILINFELPWNPAKKNQRIGRIDRMGQKSNQLTIYNFISRFSIEEQIAAGLLIKQNLFDGVLSDSMQNYVDFSVKGRSQFIQQIETFLSQQEQHDAQTALETAQNTAEKVISPTLEPENSTSSDTEQPTATSYTRQLELFEDIEDTTEANEEVDEIRTKNHPSETATTTTTTTENRVAQTADMEQVFHHGMQFLAGLFKMSTGKNLDTGEQKIEIDENTGEIVMRFKINTEK